MRHAAILAAVPVAIVMLTASSCENLDPCRNVPAAEESLVQAAADHPEIEIEAVGENEAECILTRTGDWVDETDEG